MSWPHVIIDDDIMLYDILKTSYLKIVMTISNTLNIFICPISNNSAELNFIIIITYGKMQENEETVIYARNLIING